MDNLQIIRKETDHLRRTLVLSERYNVVLFQSIVVDPDDYYYLLIEDGGSHFLSSCVGRIIPLKGKIDDEHYQYLVDVWNLNNIYQAK